MGSTADSDYLRVGRLAVEKGLLTRSQLEEEVRELGRAAYGSGGGMGDWPGGMAPVWWPRNYPQVGGTNPF